MPPKHDLRKRLLKSPSTVSRELAGAEPNQTTRRRIHELGHELESRVNEESALKAANKRHSRSIGVAKKRGEDCSELLDRTRGNSVRLREIATSITRIVDETLELSGAETVTPKTAPIDGTTPDTPMRFHSRIALDDDADATAVRIGNDADDAAWDAYVDSHPCSTVYHASRWRALIKRNFGHDGHYLSARDSDDRIVGVLPLVHLDSRLFGSFLVSMPYFNYGGPLANSAHVARQLLDHCGQLVTDLGCSHAEIRECRPRQSWTAQTHKVSMIRALPDTLESLNRELGSSVRAQVKRSLDAKPVIAFGGEELLHSFYAVFSRNMRDLGTPVYGVDFFRDMLVTFPGTFLAVVTIAGRPVAAAFLLGHRDTLEVPWASSLRSANSLGPNMFMYRSLLDEALRRGFRYFDFGRSTEDGDTFRFKKQWGAKPQRLHWHYWLAEGVSAPELNPDNPKFRLAIKCWQRLPVRLTVLLGPRIVRNLP